MEQNCTIQLQPKARYLPYLVALFLLLQLLVPYKGWMIFLVGLGGAWLLSYLWARSLAHGLKLTREMRYGWAQVGDKLQERFTLANRGRAPSTWAAGLPARLVTGYATGTYDEAHTRYVITEAEAHAWAEVCFPGYGWSEFEPTAGRPVIERPAESSRQVPAELEAPSEPITAPRRRAQWTLWLATLGGLVALSLVSAAIWLVIDGWRLRHLPPRAAVIHLYRRLQRYGSRLEISSPQGATPGEFAAALGRRLRYLAEDRRWGAWLASAPSEINRLADLCIRALYSAHRPDETEQKEAIRTWSQLQRRLWVARLLTLAPW